MAVVGRRIFARRFAIASPRLSAPELLSRPPPPSSQQFPCLDNSERKTRKIEETGLGAKFAQLAPGSIAYHLPFPLQLDYGQQLRDVQIAYETWGSLNAEKSNAILLHTGLSTSAHARSTQSDPRSGWWEKFIGPGLTLDTDKFFVICTNVLGGCYGSTGPSSFNPAEPASRYGTRFPIVTIHDMIRVQHHLVKDYLQIPKLYASMGSSMGAMQSLAYATDYPDHVENVVSISGCARSHPSSIAMRYVQRQVLMNDPHWNRGFYYEGVPPHVGMKLAREIATITYRSGPEWDARFGRRRRDSTQLPALCPDFLIETYLDHQGEKSCLEYDPNSLLYISKAMDMFDLSLSDRKERDARRTNATEPGEAYTALKSEIKFNPKEQQPTNREQDRADLVEGMRPMSHIRTLILGVESDILFPNWQQQEIYDVVREAAGSDSSQVEYVELGLDQSWYGHDTFLIDVKNVGTPIKQFLEKDRTTSA